MYMYMYMYMYLLVSTLVCELFGISFSLHLFTATVIIIYTSCTIKTSIAHAEVTRAHVASYIFPTQRLVINWQSIDPYITDSTGLT